MTVTPFHKGFDRENFECGIAELDSYLKRSVSQDIKRNSAACFVLHEVDSDQVLGYYTLSAFSARLQKVPESSRKQLPKYPHVPMTLLGRLPISQETQGSGLGELLLLDALKRAWENREVIASWAVAVDAINESARDFYLRYGFEQLEGEEFQMFLSMKQLGKLF